MSGEGQDGKKDATLLQIVSLARVPAGGRGPRHSPLYEWLWARHETLAAEFNPPRTPNWKTVAEGFAESGIVDGKGQPPTPVVIRKTWLKVNRAKEVVASGGLPQRKGKNPVGSSQPAPSTPAHVASAVNKGMLPPAIEPPEGEPPKYKFEFASAKDWTKEPNKGDE